MLGGFLVVLLVFVALLSGAKIPVPFSDQVLAWNATDEPAADKNALPDGMVWVLRSARTIPAYHAIDNEDLIQLKEGKVEFAKYPWKADEVVANGLFTIDRVSELKGRVLKRNKDKGRLFSESDFFEKGTRAGVTAGIPLGYQGMWVSVGMIEGLAGLTRDDRFDIFSVVERDDKKDKKSKSDLLDGVHKARFDLLELSKEEEPIATVEQIVRGGRVVTGVQLRSELERTNSLMSGTQTKATPKQEMFIAIRRQEIPALVKVLGTEGKVFCLPYSGRGDAEDELELAPLDGSAIAAALQGASDDAPEASQPEYGFVEVIRGDVRRLETTIVQE